MYKAPSSSPKGEGKPFGWLLSSPRGGREGALKLETSYIHIIN